MPETPINKERILKIAQDAAGRFVDGHATSLNEAILDTIGTDPFNRQQLDRIAQFTNQAAWQKLSSCKDPSTVRFNLADGYELMNCMSKEAVETAESYQIPASDSVRDPVLSMHEKIANRASRQLGLDQVKVASVNPSFVLPVNMRSWRQLAEKFARAADKVQSQRHSLDWSARQRLEGLTQAAEKLLKEGTDASVVVEAVRRSVGDEHAASRVVAYIQKEAVDKTPDLTKLAQKEFEMPILKGWAGSGLPASILQEPKHEKTASYDWGALNTEHELCKLATQVGKDLIERDKLEVAEAYLKERAKTAFKMAGRGHRSVIANG